MAGVVQYQTSLWVEAKRVDVMSRSVFVVQRDELPASDDAQRGCSRRSQATARRDHRCQQGKGRQRDELPA